DLADRLVTEDAGKWAWNVSECFVHVGIADAAGAHLHQYLTGPGLRLRDIFDLPRTAHCGNDRSFHGLSSCHASMRVPLCWVHDFTSPRPTAHTSELSVITLLPGFNAPDVQFVVGSSPLTDGARPPSQRE